MWNAGLYEAQAGIKIARRDVTNIRYTDGTTLMAEIEEELKSLLMQVKKQQSEPNPEQLTGQNCEKGTKYNKAVYCYLLITTKVQDCQKKCQQPQICRWFHSKGRKWRKLKTLWWGWKRRVKKLAKNTTLKKTKIMAGQILFSWTPKSLCMVTIAMKLKEACSLQGKLWQT